MNAGLSRLSVPLLRWTLALVVIEESLRFVFSSSATHLFVKAGLPLWIQPALGIAEAIAAALFLVPITTVAGGYALLVIFALAALIHLLHGQFEIGGLVVYAVAVVVCLVNRRNEPTEVVHE